MPQQSIDVRHIARLARLELTDEEIAEFQPQLEAILGYVETLSNADVSAVKASAHGHEVFGPMRDDVPQESLTLEDVLRNAPDSFQGQFRMPKVVTDA